MPKVPRVRVQPRAITNAVGAGYVEGPQTRPLEPIPVVVQISWDGEKKESLPALAIAWTRDYVKVQVRDDTTALVFQSWLRPEDVTRQA